MDTDDITVHILREIRDKVDALGGSLGGRIDVLSGKIDNLTDRVDDLTDRVDDLTDRVDHLTDRVDHFTDRVDVLTDRVDILCGRVDRLDYGLADFKAETRANFAGVLHIIGTTHGDLRDRVARIEHHIGASR